MDDSVFDTSSVPGLVTPQCPRCQTTADPPKAFLMKCAGCLSTYYCSKEHQRADWKRHKVACKSIQIKLAAMAAAEAEAHLTAHCTSGSIGGGVGGIGGGFGGAFGHASHASAESMTAAAAAGSSASASAAMMASGRRWFGGSNTQLCNLMMEHHQQQQQQLLLQQQQYQFRETNTRNSSSNGSPTANADCQGGGGGDSAGSASSSVYGSMADLLSATTKDGRYTLLRSVGVNPKRARFPLSVIRERRSSIGAGEAARLAAAAAEAA